MTIYGFEEIKSPTEFIEGFDSAHDDAYFGITELPGGLQKTALVDLGLYPCDDDHDNPTTRVEVLFGACEMGVDVATLRFESGYVGLEKFVDGYYAYKDNAEVTL